MPKNILDSDYNKLLYIKLEELKDSLSKVNFEQIKPEQFDEAVLGLKNYFYYYLDEFITNLSLKVTNIEEQNAMYHESLYTQIQQTSTSLSSQLINKIDDVIEDIAALDFSVDYASLSSTIYSTLLPKFNEISGLINNLDLDVDTSEIATAVQSQLSSDFTTVNNNINALSTLIENGSGSSGGATVDGDYLNSLIESLEFVVSKRKYYEPSDITPSTIPSSTTVYNWLYKMHGAVQISSAATLFISTSEIYFLTVTNNVYAFTFICDLKSLVDKTARLYLNNTLVKTATCASAHLELSHLFISTSTINSFRVDIGLDSKTPATTLDAGSAQLAGLNGVILTNFHKYFIERFHSYYYIFRNNGASISIFKTLIDNPELLPTSVSGTTSKLGYNALNAYYIKSKEPDILPSKLITLRVDYDNTATFYTNTSGYEIPGTYLSGMALGYQFNISDTLYPLGLIKTDQKLQIILSTTATQNFITMTGIPEGNAIHVHAVQDLADERVETGMIICGVTYDDGNNYLLAKYSTGPDQFTYYNLGQGSKWYMGIIHKNNYNAYVTNRIILRSYILRDNQWIRDDFVLSIEQGNAVITKINSYYIEGSYDAIHCGVDNSYIVEQDGALTILEHLPVDYSVWLNPDLATETDSTETDSTENNSDTSSVTNETLKDSDITGPLI